MQRSKHPREKNVLLIADCPFAVEIEREEPFSSVSSLQMLSSLHQVGIKQSDVHKTYLSFTRPEKENFDFSLDIKRYKNQSELYGTEYSALQGYNNICISKTMLENLNNLIEEIKKVKPKLIIVIGKWSLFLLTGMVNFTATSGSFKSLKPYGAINRYRASIMKLDTHFDYNKCLLIPIYPAIVKQREPDKIPVLNLDYKKLGFIYKDIIENGIEKWLTSSRKPVIGTTVKIITDYLSNILKQLDSNPDLFISVDIETRHSTIDCIGFTLSTKEGLVIPFSTLSNPNPWSFEEELEITLAMLKVLKHQRCNVVGQNFSYDSQYLNKFYFVNKRPSFDTMIANHVLYNYMQKDLSFLASIYVDDYSQWKDLQIHGDK